MRGVACVRCAPQRAPYLLYADGFSSNFNWGQSRLNQSAEASQLSSLAPILPPPIGRAVMKAIFVFSKALLMLALLLCSASPASAYEVLYIHTDILGSPVAYTDAHGQVARRISYDPYGVASDERRRDCPGYTGHVSDGLTALTYAEQRYYDPVLGSFLSVDPVPAQFDASTVFHRYRYANSNPYKFVDPDGRLGCTGTRISSTCQSGGVAGLRTSARSPLDMGGGAQSGAPPSPGSRAVYASGDEARSAAADHVAALNGGALRTFLVGQPYGVRLSPGDDGTGVSYELIPAVQGLPPGISKVGGVISGYTRHGLHQAISRNAGRGVAAASILSAVRNPVSVSINKAGGTIYKGVDGTKVIVNQSGKVITTYGTPRAGP